MKRILKLQTNTKISSKNVCLHHKIINTDAHYLSKQLCANKSYNTAQEDFVDKL